MGSSRLRTNNKHPSSKKQSGPASSSNSVDVQLNSNENEVKKPTSLLEINKFFIQNVNKKVNQRANGMVTN